MKYLHIVDVVAPLFPLLQEKFFYPQAVNVPGSYFSIRAYTLHSLFLVLCAYKYYLVHCKLMNTVFPYDQPFVCSVSTRSVS